MNFLTAFILAFIKNVAAPTIADIVRYIICDYADQILGDEKGKKQAPRSEIIRNVEQQKNKGKRLRFLLITICVFSAGFASAEIKDHVTQNDGYPDISIPFDGK